MIQIHALSGAAPRRRAAPYPFMAAAVMIAALVSGCGARNGEPPVAGEVSIQQAKDAISRRAEPLAAQMLETAGVCLEKAAVRKQAGETARAAALERAALTCYLDAGLAAKTVLSKRTLAFSPAGVPGAVHARPWDFSQPWDTLGPAAGAITIEKNQMAQFTASPDFADEHMDSFAAFAPGAIQYLNLGDAVKVSDAAVTVIGQMKGLLDLSLYGTGVTDRGLESLVSLPYLRQVNLMKTPVTAGGVLRLAETLPGITELALEGTQAQDKTMWALLECPRLERLICRRGHITDVGVDHLTGLPNLRRLWISGRRITDYGASMLARRENLEEIVLTETSVTEKGLQVLKSALPKCRVSCN